MSLPTKCNCNQIEIVVQHQTVLVEIETLPTDPIVEVLIPGERGESAIDKPFDIDPVQVYLKAKKGES